MLAIESPQALFIGLDGQPLESGYIYFGTANANPVTSPITVYWDAAGTQPAAQPLRTSRGMIVRNGTPARVYAGSDFSILINDSSGSLVDTARNSSEWQLDSYVDTLRTELDDSTDPALGSDLVGHYDSRAPAYLKTVSDMLNMEEVSVLRFITQSEHAAIRDGTTTYDMGARGRAAILEMQAVRGGVLKFPSGIYLCGSTTGPDGVDDGLLVPYMGDIVGPAKHIIIRGEGKNTLIKANNNNMYLVRFSDSQGGVEDLCLDWGGKSSVRLLGVVPEDTTQTSTVVDQDFNVFRNLLLAGATEGIELKTGPKVGGVDSGCFYNTFTDIVVYSCLRGIWLRDCVGTGAGNNRNTFTKIRIGGPTANTGVQIDDGDTNEFHAVHFEDIQANTTPNATPTAIKIDQTGASGLDNNSNKFFGGTIESCTRSLENINQNSEFYGVTGIYTSPLLTATPRVMIGGDPSIIPQIMPGYRYQANSQLAGVPNTAVYSPERIQSAKLMVSTGRAELGKAIVNNNAAASYNVAANISYVAFTGTNVTTLTINFPASDPLYDGLTIEVYTQAAVSVAVTFASSGATFVGAPATLTAGSVTRFRYHHATTQWLPA